MCHNSGKKYSDKDILVIYISPKNTCDKARHNVIFHFFLIFLALFLLKIFFLCVLKRFVI